jgi:serine/threonine protein kinase
MEDRYEIRGKIAQGGLGSVYKAHDVRMSRDVAIKRIITNIGDTSITDEATRQLIKEASALASLQHPNIVTIYDVGKDAEGPFVVMELLSGQTLEEIITQASFTWEDFRQLAMQCLEALIAAQELHIVHRDIKPGNIMLTWLPSGKFQVKVVDFGLAKLSAKPSLQTIDQSDGVFGSIYFMGPEQFERIPIDQRVDLYAIGCVFYYALTGTYPFDGDSAVQVMASHLQHHVTPIQEVRAGVPMWACDWIMWLINRQPSDRPESAREALHVFMQNDSAWISPQLSTGEPTPIVKPETSKRPKLFIPGAVPEPEAVEETNPNQPPKKTASASKPLTPPSGSKASVHNTTKTYQVAETPAPAPEPEPISYAPPVYETPAPPQLVVPQIAPPQIQPPVLSIPTPTPTLITPTLVAQPASSPTQPLGPAQAKLTPTAAAVQSPHFLNKPHITHALTPTSQLNRPQPTAQAVEPAPEAIPAELYAPAPKKPISTSLKVVIALVLSIIVIFMTLYLIDRSNENAEIALYNQMIKLAANEATTEVPVNKEKLGILLRNASSPAGQEDRSAIYRALILAKATDKTDVDNEIADHAIEQDMHGENVKVRLSSTNSSNTPNPHRSHGSLSPPSRPAVKWPRMHISRSSWIYSKTPLTKSSAKPQKITSQPLLAKVTRSQHSEMISSAHTKALLSIR